MNNFTKYTFSGHESFSCKSLWLKKGYDFVASGCDFNSPNSVVELGVGKNMVGAIRYWMRAFGMLKEGELTPMAHYLFHPQSGRDVYAESLGTLWLLHILIVHTRLASLYHLLFLRYQKERRSFDRQGLLNFVKRVMTESGKLSVYNENTLKKDIGVLLQNYMVPSRIQSYEDYSSLLIDLDLLRADDGKIYSFNTEGKRNIPEEILLYAILMTKDHDRTVSSASLQDLSLACCMSETEMTERLLTLQAHYPDAIRYSDTSGIRQLQFIKGINPILVLDSYYNNHA